MCGRFVLVQKISTLEKRFNALAENGIEYSPSYNIHPGAKSIIVTNNHGDKISSATFGFTPHWSKKQMYLFNARAEGNRNKDNNPKYSGAKEIINKPSFAKAIRQNRCLVPADAFIEGTTDKGLSKPYLVFLRNKVRPFAFAGIWGDWQTPDGKKIIRSFSIITTTANELLQKIPHHRSPVILSQQQEKLWLSQDAHLSDITALLRPYDSSLMNAYPISDKIKNPKNNSPELIQPRGNRLVEESEIQIQTKIQSQGFGRKKRFY